MSAFDFGKLAQGSVAAVALVALVAGCSSSAAKSAAGGASSGSQGTAAVSGSGSALKTRSTSIGKVLVDGSGRTVYELVGDTAAHQTCTGGCLSTWPPVMANGSQVVVNGHPAFTFAGDSAAGQTKGQNVTDQWGKWVALDASGKPISVPAAAKTSSAPAGGGPAF